MKLKLLILFLALSFSNFAQKKKDVTIAGTAYIKSSISPGVVGMDAIKQAETPFKNQTIYFQRDTMPMLYATTDEQGKFSLALKPGVYTVYQADGLKKQETKGLDHFGTVVIDVKNEGNEAFTILFENHSNRRQAMGAKGMPGGKTTGQKSTKKE